LDFFRELGLTILERWRRADLDARAFPDIAAAALQDRPPSAHVDPMDVIRWVHEAPMLTPQTDIAAKFGQPPITVFHGEKFYIDVLFWVDGATSIHQHGFSGAFHVMRGSSIESTFRFQPRRRYSEFLMTGDLTLQGVALREKGDVAPIVAGVGFIHSLFHLDRPSVSVVVRTPSDALAGPQYSYSRAGLAFDPFARSDALDRRLQTLELLRKLDSPEFEPLATASVRQADAFLAFRLLTALATRIEPHEKYLAFLRSVKPAHAELVDALLVHADLERRDRHIITRRQLATLPDHRFFLALLLNLEDRASIFEMVRRARPALAPAEAIVGWLSDFQKLDAINAWVTEVAKTKPAPILDVPMDETSLRVARDLLDGRGDEPAPPEVAERRAAIRGSSLLRPLFLARHDRDRPH
jgi:hypothetical protein